MSLIVLWKYIRVGAWVRIKMSGEKRTLVYCLSPRRCKSLPARANGGSRLPRSPLQVLLSLPGGREPRRSTGGTPSIH